MNADFVTRPLEGVVAASKDIRKIICGSGDWHTRRRACGALRLAAEALFEEGDCTSHSTILDNIIFGFCRDLRNNNVSVWIYRRELGWLVTNVY